MKTNNVNAEIISIGTEILLGELTDTNSVFMARALRDLGINLYYMTSVGDNLNRIVDAIGIALSRADIIITCGGLGPTVDDMTRQAVAEATNRGLTFHQSLLNQIAARFARFKVTMTENNKQQAYLPDNSMIIENPVGTAPCFIVEHEKHFVISLPGVPREMKYLFNKQVIPFLKEQYQLGIIKTRTLKTAGIGESTLDTKIGKDLLNMGNPTIGLAAHSGQIDIRITAKAATEKLADELIHQMEVQVRERAGYYIFGTDDDTLEETVVKLLYENNYQLNLVQVGLGDIFNTALSPLASKNIIHSEVLETPDMLSQKFGLSNDQSLPQLSHDVIDIVCCKTEKDASIVVVSIPDVNENADNAQNTVVVVKTAKSTRERIYGFGAQSEVVRDWVKSWALSALWRMIKEEVDGK